MEKTVETTVVKIDGMTCGACVNSVTRVLKTVPGVREATVSLEPGEAHVSFDPARADIAKIRKAIEDAGYEVR